jgi:hypothetical protein
VIALTLQASVTPEPTQTLPLQTVTPSADEEPAGLGRGKPAGAAHLGLGIAGGLVAPVGYFCLRPQGNMRFGGCCSSWWAVGAVRLCRRNQPGGALLQEWGAWGGWR